MPITKLNDAGIEETFYTPAELEEAKQAEAAAFAEREKTLQAELDKERRVSAEKTENFKKLRDMTEAEKSQMTAQQIADRKIAEEAMDRAKAVEDLYKSDTEARANSKKSALIDKLSGGNAELKQKLTDSWDVINIPGTDDASIEARATGVFNYVTGGVHAPNPLTQGFSGEAPSAVAAKKEDEFINSEKGKAALSAMGIADAPKPAV
jgi:hypothetical protein